MDRACLKEVGFGDTVRVRFLLGDDCWQNRYIEITKVLSPTHFLGYVNDPYINENRNGCNICNEHIPCNNIYACNGVFENDCDYHVHKKCMKTNGHDKGQCDNSHVLKKYMLTIRMALKSYLSGTILSRYPIGLRIQRISVPSVEQEWDI